jgi:uncharacterized membrane protein YedE/YeeE
MQRIAALVAGLVFGAGLALSGMVNPLKVVNFLDLFGTWDPTLIFVMGAGLAVTFIGYRLVLARAKPLYADAFSLPATTLIDARLIGGSVLFGLGWGLTGFCPGPAIASLVFGLWPSVLFVAAMAVGMIATKLIMRRASAGAPHVADG